VAIVYACMLMCACDMVCEVCFVGLFVLCGVCYVLECCVCVCVWFNVYLIVCLFVSVFCV